MSDKLYNAQMADWREVLTLMAQPDLEPAPKPRLPPISQEVDARELAGRMSIRMSVQKLRRWRFRLKLAGWLVRLAARICWMDAEKSEVVEV